MNPLNVTYAVTLLVAALFVSWVAWSSVPGARR